MRAVVADVVTQRGLPINYTCVLSGGVGDTGGWWRLAPDLGFGLVQKSCQRRLDNAVV